MIDLHKWIDNKLFHFINFFYRGVLSAWINGQKNPVVLGGECIYFYKVIPYLKKSIRCIEVCHLATWLPYSIGFIDRIDVRVFSTERLKQDVETQYQENQLPDAYYRKLVFIDNAIDIPAYSTTANNELQVYFIGRGVVQKRVHLVAAIAEKIHSKQLPVKFNFVGDVEKVINTIDYPYCRFYGNVKDVAVMKQIYEEADVLLMTSSFEGLPVAVMQMMSYGKAIISTAVNGIPDYVKHYVNGLLITSTEEDKIVEEGAAYVEELAKNRGLLLQFGQTNRELAIEKFGREMFCKRYRHLLWQE